LSLDFPDKTTVPVYVLPVLLIRIRMDLYQNRIRIGIKVKVQELWSGGSKWSHGGPWTLAMEAWRIKTESLDQWSQIRIISMRSRIRIRIKVK
jgi:hypothetical protein